MHTILIISGKESSEFARGGYNQALFQQAVDLLSPHYRVLKTVIEDGYDVAEEIAKFKQADVVIYQYPVYWFTMPSSMKKYIDEVYAYGVFFGPSEGPYGSGGLMKGKKFMIATTWNAPVEAFDDPTTFNEGLSAAEVQNPMRKTHQFCGFEELPHFSCHDIIRQPNMDRDRVRWAKHLAEVFPLITKQLQES